MPITLRVLYEFHDSKVSWKTQLKFLGSWSLEFPRCQIEAVNLFKTFGLENSNDWTPSFIGKVCQNGIVNRNHTTFWKFVRKQTLDLLEIGKVRPKDDTETNRQDINKLKGSNDERFSNSLPTISFDPTRYGAKNWTGRRPIDFGWTHGDLDSIGPDSLSNPFSQSRPSIVRLGLALV